MSERTTFSASFSAQPQAHPSIVAAAISAGVDWLLGAICTPVEAVEAKFRQMASQNYDLYLRQYQLSLARAGASSTRERGQFARASQGLARAKAAFDALRGESALMTIAKRVHQPSLQEGERLLLQAAALHQQGQLSEAVKQAEEAETLLAKVGYDSQRQLEAAQRRVLSGVVAEALRDIGYSIQVAHSDRAIAMWATRGQHNIAVAVTKGSRIDVDMAGFEGLSCGLESQRFMAELMRRGLEVRRDFTFHHGRREGGNLILSAARTARNEGVTPARGLLGAVTGPARSTESAPAQRATSQASAASQPATDHVGTSERDRARRWLWAKATQVIQ